MELPKSIINKLDSRRHNNAMRQLKNKTTLVDFSSNDYLGFAASDVIHQKALQYITDENSCRNGSTGSRLLTGNHHLYGQLEQKLAEFHQAEAAVVFNSGYDANVGLLSAVLQRNDIVIFDEYAHASIRDGIQMARAKTLKFRHNDVADLEKKINNSRKNHSDEGAMYIVTESVFSMDGDRPDLLKLVEIAEKNNAFLIIDEAHATGVLGENGQGLIQKLGMSNRIFARIHTFGKALGAHGAVILGSRQLIDYLVNFSRALIYTTALPPHSIATVLAAYDELKNTSALQQLNQNILLFKNQIIKNQLDSFFIPSESSIQACLISGNQKVKTIAEALQNAGFDVKPILSPTVPEGKERLRFCLHNFNKEQEIILVLQLLRELLKNND